MPSNSAAWMAPTRGCLRNPSETKPMKLVPGIVALAVLCATAPLYNWTGFYIGGHAGGAFSGSNSFNGLVLSNYDARFLGGVQAGADYQFAGNWVAGIEGQYSWLGSNHIGAIFPAGFVYSNNQRGLGSVTGRIGYSWGPALFYAKGGYAYSDNRETLTFGGAPVAFTLDRSHRDGYTVGGGVEYLFTPNWSATAEDHYSKFGPTA